MPNLEVSFECPDVELIWDELVDSVKPIVDVEDFESIKGRNILVDTDKLVVVKCVLVDLVEPTVVEAMFDLEVSFENCPMEIVDTVIVEWTLLYAVIGLTAYNSVHSTNYRCQFWMTRFWISFRWAGRFH